MGAKGAAVVVGGFCLNRIRPHVKIRSPQPQQQQQTQSSTKINTNINIAAPEKRDRKVELVDEENKSGEGRKVMIVVDSSAETKVALHWALSHTIQTHDSLLLLHVAKQGSTTSKGKVSRGGELVNSLTKMCHIKRPEVVIEAAVVEGKEKGPAIVEEAKKQGVSLLVLGQRKRSMTWRLIMMWASNRSVNAATVAGGVVEYCIQNAECMAIAVRRKSKKHGGYLITTKRHKDFWLLA